MRFGLQSLRRRQHHGYFLGKRTLRASGASVAGAFDDKYLRSIHAREQLAVKHLVA
jgi:hypothetical protein